jgi:hypothetical protein
MKSVVPTQKKVINDTHMAKQFYILKRPGNSQAGDLVRLPAENRPSFKKDISLYRLIDPADAVKKRGLPCTIGANHSVDLPLSNFHVDLLQRDNTAKCKG